VEADNQASAEAKVEMACKKMLANQIMESFSFSVTEA
jgi:phosphoribosylformylglycinamidine synthase